MFLFTNIILSLKKTIWGVHLFPFVEELDNEQMPIFSIELMSFSKVFLGFTLSAKK